MHTQINEMEPNKSGAVPKHHFGVQSNQLNVDIATVTKYLDSTGIEETFKLMLSSLLALPELPYNPYPGFIRRFKSYMERFHMEQKSDEEIAKLLVSVVNSSNLAYIFYPNHCDYVWGLRNIVELAEPKSMKQLFWLFDSLSLDNKWADRRGGYSTQIMLALVGPTVFHGLLYAYPATVHIRMEYLITGANANEATDIFITSVVGDILHTEQDNKHIFIGVTLPKKSPTEKHTWTTEFWDYEEITNKKDTFWSLVKDAITANHYVHCEVLFRMDPDGHHYMIGEKQYALNFTQVSDTGEDQGLSYFTEFPLVTLHEGVFLRQSDAESYLATFTPKVDLANVGQEQKTGKKTKTKKKKPPVEKVRLDGFVLGDRSGYTPEAEAITAPIKSAWQRQVAGLDPNTELFDIIQHVILLIQMDRDAYDEKLMIEIYRILHGTAARLHGLMVLNKTIRKVINKILKADHEEENEVVTNLFMQYKIGLIELFDSPLSERSSDQVTCMKVITKRLDDVLAIEGEKCHHVPLVKKTIDILKNLNSYIFTLYIGLLEDAFVLCPALKDLIATLKKAFPDEVKRPSTRNQDTPPSEQQDLEATGQRFDYKHGVEDTRIFEHDNQVINVKACVNKSVVTKEIKGESVLLKYITDTHLDEIWPHFLIDLVIGNILTPNPYPQLVTALRQAAMKMDLQFQSSDQLLQDLINSSIKEEDPEHFVYHLPGCDAHGLKTAMTLLDQEAFLKLTPVVAGFIQKEFKMRQGPYRIAICCAVSGFTTIFGKMDPYLRQIELHEHCYIRGPEGCWAEATEVYSKIVYSHMKGLYKQQTYFIVGLYFGGSDKMWSMEEILSRKKGFAAEFESCCYNRTNVYLKLYVQTGWRIVPVCKYFKFHFINDNETRYEVLYSDNPAHLYQNVFLEKERAAFHYQFGGCPDMSNPHNQSNVRYATRAINEEILVAEAEQDWLNVYRWLLLRNIISQGSLLVPEVWRMLHSVAGQIEYVNSLSDSLSDLISYAMRLHERHEDTKLTYVGTTREEEESILKQLNSSLGKMVTAYRDKVSSICRMSCSLMPRALLDIIQDKLQSVIERDPINQKIYIHASTKSLSVLEEVRQMLCPIQDAVAYDVHSICSESQAMLNSIHIEMPTHLERVPSAELKDYHQYTHRPAANIMDHPSTDLLLT